MCILYFKTDFENFKDVSVCPRIHSMDIDFWRSSLVSRGIPFLSTWRVNSRKTGTDFLPRKSDQRCTLKLSTFWDIAWTPTRFSLGAGWRHVTIENSRICNRVPYPIYQAAENMLLTSFFSSVCIHTYFLCFLVSYLDKLTLFYCLLFQCSAGMSFLGV